jgi:hypothetical protein
VSLSGVVAQYETLRGAALGQALPPEARSGLTLFLRRGMWGWARAAAAMSMPQQPIGLPSWSFTASDKHRAAVIHVFAAMAMNADHRGAAS